MTLKEAIDTILPNDVNEEKKPRLRTPSLMQAVLLPFYKVPVDKETGQRPTWNNSPHLNQLKNEIFICTIPMVTVPFIAFFAV